MKIAVCYLTCTKNNLYFNFDRLIHHAETSQHDVSVFTYVNDETSTYEKNDNCITFSWKYLQDKFNYHHSYEYLERVNMGIQFLSLIDLYDTYKEEFDFYVFFEDDLMLNTSRNIFDKISFNHDVGLIHPRINDSNWTWANYKNNVSNLYKPMTGLLNYYYFKTKILKKFIDDTVNNNLYAHHEYLINGFLSYNPTIVISYLDRKYKCCIRLSQDEIKKYKNKRTIEIIHPVKNKETYDLFVNQNII